MEREVEALFRKSSYSQSNGGSCVEVGRGTHVLIRDTKQAGRVDRTVLEVSGDAWSKFTGGLK